jgi:hypothetical protein
MMSSASIFSVLDDIVIPKEAEWNCGDVDDHYYNLEYDEYYFRFWRW